MAEDRIQRIERELDMQRKRLDGIGREQANLLTRLHDFGNRLTVQQASLHVLQQHERQWLSRDQVLNLMREEAVDVVLAVFTDERIQRRIRELYTLNGMMGARIWLAMIAPWLALVIALLALLSK